MQKYWCSYVLVLNTTPPQSAVSSIGFDAPHKVTEYAEILDMQSGILASLRQQGLIPPDVQAVVNVLSFQPLDTLLYAPAAHH